MSNALLRKNWQLLYGARQMTDITHYLQRLQEMPLQNPVLVGFGIHDKASFEAACAHSNGAIIGSAYIKALEKSSDVVASTKAFLAKILA